MKEIPPRLDVLLASEAPIGIVFRRGPTKLVRVYLWNCERDTFKPCQWFKGKIYPDRSDLSPDGRYMIYFAMVGLAWAIPATSGTRTAISRMGQGDTCGGGGMLRRDSKRPAPSRMERDGWVRKQRQQPIAYFQDTLARNSFKWKCFTSQLDAWGFFTVP